jgi:hypothetical protein
MDEEISNATWRFAGVLFGVFFFLSPLSSPKLIFSHTSTLTINTPKHTLPCRHSAKPIGPRERVVRSMDKMRHLRDTLSDPVTSFGDASCPHPVCQ